MLKKPKMPRSRKALAMEAFIAAALVFLTLSAHAQTTDCNVVVDASQLRLKINKNIYGQFSEHLGGGIYGGIWVGQNSAIPNTNGIRSDVVEALRRIKVPVLRWPGGCFADEYHWKDGIGPRASRPAMVNTNWGGVTENNSFGTHEYLELCRQLGCDAYICGNVGSGTVQELSQWVEYVNSDNSSPITELRRRNGRDSSWGVQYWGIGNESWGCGGNMRPEFYADQIRRYGTFCRNYGKNKVFKIACGPSDDDYGWTDVMMKNAYGYMDGLSLHHYSFGDGGAASDFDERGWFDILKKTMQMDEYLARHSAIMDKTDPNKKIALVVDEWGTWHAVEPGTNPAFLYQQNTMRDAVAAACSLNILNNHCDRVRMANIAQTINVLQSMILTNGAKILLTPTYYVFDLFKVHQDALWVKTTVESVAYVYGGLSLPSVNCSASIDTASRLHISFCNIDPKSERRISCELEKFSARSASGQILTAKTMNAHNTFDTPGNVVPQDFSDFTLAGKNLKVVLPPMSVVVVELQGTVELNPGLDIKNPKAGVRYDYYEGRWDRLPAFDSLSPKRSSTIEQFEIPPNNSGEDFALQYDGYIRIASDGLYTFSVTSDDGSDLSIDKNLIVDNDGRHASQEESGTVVLRAGFHEIHIRFFQASGGKILDAHIEGPGLAKQIIPAEMLFH
jgi:alpha-L-arabinofuranosidase